MRIDPEALTIDGDELDVALLERMCSGEASREEIERFDTWLVRYPDRRDGYERIVARFRGGREQSYTAAGKAQRVSSIIRALSVGEVVTPRRRSAVSRSRLTAILSASAVILLLLGVWLSGTRRTLEPVQRYATAAGQRSTVRLVDGSQVTLAPATRVEVRQDTVTVHGAAYFQIVPRPDRPFIVRTANAVVQVLGTTFVVRQYADERNTSVVVEDGKVAVGARQSGVTTHTPAVITPRMLAQVTDSGVIVTSGVTTREYTSWTQGMLVFKLASLRDVVAELGRTYGADVRVADSVLARKTLSAEIEVRQSPLTQVLEFIGVVLDAHYTRDGSAYILSAGHRVNRIPTGLYQQKQLPQPEKQYGR